MKRNYIRGNKPNSSFDFAVILFSGALIGMLFSFGGFNLPQLPFQLPFGNPAVRAAIQSQDAFVFDFADISTGSETGRALRINAPSGVTFNVTEAGAHASPVRQVRTVYFSSNRSSDALNLWFRTAAGGWRRGTANEVDHWSDAEGYEATISVFQLNVSVPVKTRLEVGLVVGRDNIGRVIHGSIGSISLSRSLDNRTWVYPVYGGSCEMGDRFRENRTKRGNYSEYFISGFSVPQSGPMQLRPRYEADPPCENKYGIVEFHSGVLAHAAYWDEDGVYHTGDIGSTDIDKVSVGFFSPGGMLFRTISENRIVVEVVNRR